VIQDDGKLEGEQKEIVNILKKAKKITVCGGSDSGVHRFIDGRKIMGVKKGKHGVLKPGSGGEGPKAPFIQGEKGLICYLRFCRLPHKSICTFLAFVRNLVSGVNLKLKINFGSKSGVETIQTRSVKVGRVNNRIKEMLKVRWGKTPEEIKGLCDGKDSIMIVRGMDCVDLFEYIDRCDGTKVGADDKIGLKFAVSLGASHIIDILLGNGDRLHHPNLGNIFLRRDSRNKVLLLDLDCTLPYKYDSLKNKKQKWGDLVYCGEYEGYVKDHWQKYGAGPYTTKIRHFKEHDFKRCMEEDLVFVLKNVQQHKEECKRSGGGEAAKYLKIYNVIESRIKNVNFKNHFVLGATTAMGYIAEQEFSDLVTCYVKKGDNILNFKVVEIRADVLKKSTKIGNRPEGKIVSPSKVQAKEITSMLRKK